MGRRAERDPDPCGTGHAFGYEEKGMLRVFYSV